MPKRLSAQTIAEHADVSEKSLRRYRRGLPVRPSVRRRILTALRELGLADPHELAALAAELDTVLGGSDGP